MSKLDRAGLNVAKVLLLDCLVFEYVRRDLGASRQQLRNAKFNGWVNELSVCAPWVALFDRDTCRVALKARGGDGIERPNARVIALRTGSTSSL
jgi:hypothetical protein